MKRLLIALLTIPILGINAANPGDRIQSAIDAARKQQADETKSSSSGLLKADRENALTNLQELGHAKLRAAITAYEVDPTTEKARIVRDFLIELQPRIRIPSQQAAKDMLLRFYEEKVIKLPGTPEKYETGTILPERSTPAGSVLTPPPMGQPTNFR